MSLLNREQVGSSVSNTRMRTMDDAKSRIIAGLKGQLAIWNKDKGESLPPTKQKGSTGPAKSSLWFKKKEMNNDWLLKIKLGNTNLYLSAKAEKDRNPYFSVAESEMASNMESTMKEVANGEWDKYIKPIIDKANNTK